MDFEMPDELRSKLALICGFIVGWVIRGIHEKEKR